MMHEKFKRRFEELAQSFASLPFHQNMGESGRHVEAGDWMRWATSAQNLILAVYGDNSPHYQNFINAVEKCVGYDYDVLALRGIFLSAKDDFDGGYVFNVDMRVSGEVLGDFIVLARQSLAEGYKDVAAVLACAALEDALKRYAHAQNIATDNKSMTEVVNALKGSGKVSGAQKTLLDAMPKIRNFALHAEWSKFSEPDVNSVIGFVEQFLLTKFGDA
jgi:hypothetical protein